MGNEVNPSEQCGYDPPVIVKQAIAEETTRQQEKDLDARCDNGSLHPQSTLTKTRLIYTSKFPKATTHKETQGNLT